MTFDFSQMNKKELTKLIKTAQKQLDKIQVKELEDTLRGYFRKLPNLTSISTELVSEFNDDGGMDDFINVTYDCGGEDQWEMWDKLTDLFNSVNPDLVKDEYTRKSLKVK